MKTDRCFIINARTGVRAITRDGLRYQVIDLNQTPKRVLNKWFKRGFYFAPAILIGR